VLERITTFIRELYQEPDNFIPLHAPIFSGNEKKYLCNCVDTTFVSSVGEYVNQFETMIQDFTKSRKAVAVANGTCGLTTALSLAGVQPGDLVLTQALTFVATANAIRHIGAKPAFLDSDKDTLGMSPDALRAFLEHHDSTRQRIAACVPVHILGHACRIREICDICKEWNIPVVEDAAEALGSTLGTKHLGTFGLLGVLSFNGNKTITTGGGGMILTNDDKLGIRAKHLTTTAKIPHPWEFQHDEIAWNYRMPNINAALGCGQMEQLQAILDDKKCIAQAYRNFFAGIDDIQYIDEPNGCKSNFWLNTILFPNREKRDEFLVFSNNHGIMARPLWTLMPDLPMYKTSPTDNLVNARLISERAVSLPSSPRLEQHQ
jgi:aminotransferase in exopolysaccharide biosynthesis